MIKNFNREKLLIGLLAGLLLAVIAVPLPGEKKEKKAEKLSEDSVRTAPEEGVEEHLKKILSRISGVGEVEVLITYADSGRLIVEKDEAQSEELIRETDSSGGNRTTTTTENKRETVYGSAEQPYVVQELSPQVEGVLVVAQGAGNASVKRQIMETIKALFGLESHKISIMKMEVSN